MRKVFTGKYGAAVVYTDVLEKTAEEQIVNMCNNEIFEDSKIRIMPDVHAGKGCTIGTTMTINKYVVPNLVGVDIGCGMYVENIGHREIDFEKLEKVINKHVPSGFSVRQTEHKFARYIDLKQLKCFDKIKNIDRIYQSIGTLGGGNHFIEVNQSKHGIFLVIHSGSRNLGHQVCSYYQNLAIESIKEKQNAQIRLASIAQPPQKREEYFKEIRKKFDGFDYNLAYLEGQNLRDYLHDMNIVQEFADLNRKTIAYEIVTNMDWEYDGIRFSTIHNYIDLKNKILRKGAISADDGELVIIPLNMKDGSIIARGKGNDDWNRSAPHGAGRIMSRNEANKLVNMEQFKESMKDVWSKSVTEKTIDESPMAYKPMEAIVDKINPTVEILEIIKPIYNYKAH